MDGEVAKVVVTGLATVGGVKVAPMIPDILPHPFTQLAVGIGSTLIGWKGLHGYAKLLAMGAGLGITFDTILRMFFGVQ